MGQGGGTAQSACTVLVQLMQHPQAGGFKGIVMIVCDSTTYHFLLHWHSDIKNLCPNSVMLHGMILSLFFNVHKIRCDIMNIYLFLLHDSTLMIKQLAGSNLLHDMSLYNIIK